MLRALLRALARRPCPVRIGPVGWALELPPVARFFLPQATAEEAITYNRARKAMAIALHLFRTGHTAACRLRDVEAAATALGWTSVSAQTHAAVRANLGVLHADPAIHKQP